MNATKLIAFLLVLVSLAGILFFAAISLLGPFLLGDQVSAPPPLDRASPGCQALLMFAVSLPLAAIPGLGGLGLWFFVIRKQEAAREQETVLLAECERAFQIRLDGLARRLLDCGGDAAVLAPEIPVWTRGLDEPRRNRLLGFLAESGAWEGASPGPALGASGERAQDSAGCARALVVSLFVFAGFCLLWGALTIFAQLATRIEPIQGIRPGPETALAGSLGCFLPGLAALFGALMLRWLLSRDRRRRRQRESAFDRMREIVLEGCLGRARWLGRDQEAIDLGSQTVAGRIGRADVLCTLRELDGMGKGRLIARLHADGFLSRLSLQGADLRGAILAGADLCGAALPGVDLATADLSGARLARADLSGACLRGADLRSADAEGAALRQADLRQARVHRCSLRQADLRESDWKEANLWQADLAGAELKGARITVDQLRATLGGAALLPGSLSEANS